MVSKGLIAATAAVALAAMPAIAAANSARIAPAAETVFGSQQGETDGSGIYVAVGAAIAVLLGIWAATDGGDDAPASPN